MYGTVRLRGACGIGLAVSLQGVPAFARGLFFFLIFYNLFWGGRRHSSSEAGSPPFPKTTAYSCRKRPESVY